MPLVADQAGNTFVEHNNGQLSHYKVDDFTDPWKPTQTILIQHGFGRNVNFWYKWVPVLAQNYRVIRRDLRGHGLSSHPGSAYDYSLDIILGEITDTMDQLGIEKFHFLGESTSGMLGEALAVKHPERLMSLIICSSPTHLPPSTLEFFAFGKKDWPTACRELGSRGWAQALRKVPGTMASEDPEYPAWWLDQVSSSAAEGLAGYAELLSKLDARPFLKDIRKPMLILAPMNSAVMSVASMEEVAGQVEGAELRVIDAPGHEIFTSGAEQCQKAVLEFLDSL
ncbi:alpha/beta-hydrolase [Sarocladium strictum]